MARFFSNKERLSETALVAINAMKALRDTEGTDIIHRIYAEIIYEQRQQEYANRYGLKLSSTQQNCLCYFLGKRCPSMYGNFYKSCIRFEGIDHFSLYNRKGKPFVYISQPYGVGTKQLKSIIELCENHDLDVRIDGYSWHYPDSTVLVEIHRKGWWKEIEEEKAK